MRLSRGFCAALAVLAVTIVGCGRATFTEAVRARYDFSADDFRRVQFFTSEEIVLRRDISDQAKGRAGNKLSVRDGIVTEQVVIPRHTPCAVLRVEHEFLLVSFSRARPDQALWFSSASSNKESLSPDQQVFHLVPIDNPLVENVPFVPHYTTGFLVTYGGTSYQVADASSWAVDLLYEMDEAYAKSTVRQTPDGWKLSDGVPPASTSIPSASSSSSAAPAP